MSADEYVASADEQRALEAFYFREARLLDNRQYQQWLELVDESIRYTMPARSNVQVDNRERGSEAMISVERELEAVEGQGNPIRDEQYLHLMLRVERAYKVNSWSENPPARTRRIVGNVELMSKSAGQLGVVSNFLLYYARPGSREFIYSGQRRDSLQPHGEGFRILRRDVVLDYADIDKPTLGLLF